MTCFRSLSSVSFASRSILLHHLRWLRLLFSALSHYYGLDRGSFLENESLDWRDGLSFRKSGPSRLSLIRRVTRWRVSNMLRLFHPVKGAGLKYIAPNKFVIKFNHALDREKALGGCPWVLDKHALLFESIDATKKPVDQQLTGMPYHRSSAAIIPFESSWVHCTATARQIRGICENPKGFG